MFLSSLPPPSKSKPILCLFLLSIILQCASSARVLLDDTTSDPAVLVSPPGVSFPSGTPFSNGGPANTLPLGTNLNTNDVPTGDSVDPPPAPDAALAPVADVTPSLDVAPVSSPVDVGQADPPVPDAPITSNSVVPGGAVVGGAAVSGTGQAELTFFMHDIVGGSHPSARVVTGVITATDLNAVPFSTPANNIFPLTGGVPLLNGNNPNLHGANLNGIINNNNLPFIAGLNGQQQVSTIIQNNGNNNQVTGGNNQPFVTAGALPAGATIQNLMFGTITVVDDELTETHELDSAVLGKAQGFYLASSLDGTSKTMAITLLFHGNDKEVVDTISLFGVHRTASPDSQVAIIGGTGKYEHVKGYANIVTLPQVDQHTTDGVDTILQFNVYFL